MPLYRQADAPLLNAPEQVGLLELRNRPGIHKVRGGWIKTIRGGAVAVELGPMAWRTESRKEALSLHHIFGCVRNRIGKPDEFAGGSRMHRPVLGRGL